MNSLKLVAAALLSASAVALARSDPWLPNPTCAVAPRGTKGLLASAMQALETVGVAHRITRSLDLDSSAANYHGPDVTISDEKFTAAVDISVRCLDEEGIKQLLGRLAVAGFAAWYRANGKDSWKGADHVHAVWAAEPLKRQLRGQVQSWLEGKTGLVGDAQYKFWQPSEDQRLSVKSAYDRSAK
jgi:hypothetical protein